MAIFTVKHATITGQDATGTPITKTLGPGAGNLTIGAIQAGLVEATPVYNRGTFLELVEGQQQAVEVGLELFQDGKVSLAAGAANSPSDLVLKKGDLAAGTTVDPGGQVWTVDIVLVMTRAGVTSTCTIKNCRCSMAWSEALEGNKLAISGTAYGTGSTLPVVWS